MALGKTIEFPNLEGKHLSLKYTNAEDTGELKLLYVRYVLPKFFDHTDADAIQPNIEGTHLTMKIYHDLNTEFILAYSSMILLAYKE